MSGIAPSRQAAAQTSRAPFPIGGYFGNPNGNDARAEAAFEAQFNSFVSVLGATPQVMNAFVDFGQGPSNWPSNASWTAWSWTRSPVVGHSLIPIIGIPMSDNGHWAGNAPGFTNDDFFKAIIAGTYDGAYKGVVDAWSNAGFKTLYLRFGYEMNGGFMPWYMGSTAAVQADWVAAFKHMATLMRAQAATTGATAYVVWNPTDINWTQLQVAAAYPGDEYVDVISTDAYSPTYPSDLYNWRMNDGTADATLALWASKSINRRHFWSYPGGTRWSPLGASGWGMEDTIALALAHRKPMAISETGAGGNGTTTGPVDDAAFPRWLALKIRKAQTAGVRIAYVCIWDVRLGDGNWDFSSAGSSKPQEAAAWAAFWGANAALRAQ